LKSERKKQQTPFQYASLERLYRVLLIVGK
jgi:hypothetical protein